MKNFFLYVVAGVCLIVIATLAPMAFAGNIEATWTNPTQRVNGDPLPESDINEIQIDYRVKGTNTWQYGGTQAQPAQQRKTIGVPDVAVATVFQLIATAKTTDASEPITATNPTGAGQWSAPSVIAEVTMPPVLPPTKAKPKPPTILNATATP